MYEALGLIEVMLSVFYEILSENAIFLAILKSKSVGTVDALRE